jgi:hypothetical protein
VLQGRPARRDGRDWRVLISTASPGTEYVALFWTVDRRVVKSQTFFYYHLQVHHVRSRSLCLSKTALSRSTEPPHNETATHPVFCAPSCLPRHTLVRPRLAAGRSYWLPCIRSPERPRSAIAVCVSCGKPGWASPLGFSRHLRL